jgi:hypothetical protein
LGAGPTRPDQAPPLVLDGSPALLFGHRTFEQLPIQRGS